MPDEILLQQLEELDIDYAAIIADCNRIVRDAALNIAAFKNRLTVKDASERTGLNHTQIRGAIERGELKALDTSMTGSGTGKNKSYRTTILMLDDYIRHYPGLVNIDPLP